VCGKPERYRVHADGMLPPPEDRSFRVFKGRAHPFARCDELDHRRADARSLGCSAGAFHQSGGVRMAGTPQPPASVLGVPLTKQSMGSDYFSLERDDF
jgi:hypothetical protein